jgi:regulatory protein YycH of two-component signal transduction system YycFG
VPIEYFNSYYSQRVSTHKSFNFNYVVVPLNHSKKAYFVNTQSKTITTVTISKIDTTEAWKVAARLPKALTVNFKVVNGHVMLNYPKEFKLPVYSYLVNHRDPTTYVSALLGTTNQLTQTTENNKKIYTNKYSNQQIIYDPDLETVTFTDNRTTGTLQRSYYNRLNVGFSQINLLQLDLSDTRFYQSRDNGKDITYRTFVEGLPVYYQSKTGAIHMTLDKYGNLTSTYSLNELGVPVPNTQEDVTLPKAADVLAKLQQAGVKSSEYYSIAPGYEWLANKENDVSVNMNPTWMIETPTGWMSVNTFLANRE